MMTYTFLILSTLSLFLSIAYTRTVTSKGVCLSDADCPNTNTYCVNSGEYSYRCKPRLSLNAICTFSSDVECKSGLYCTYNVSKKARICTAQSPFGGSCNWFEDNGCVGKNTYCDRALEKCVRATASVGKPCDGQAECDGTKGLYCEINTGKCRKKKKTGKTCTLFDENFTYNEDIDCETFCAKKTLIEGTCAPWVKLGGKCKDDRQCIGKTQKNVRLRPRCNHGFCTLQRDILNSLGAACKRGSDKCNEKKSLSCRWLGTKRKFVCQHFSNTNEFCKPGSPLSKCFPTEDGEPTECRLQRNYQLIDSDGSYEYSFPKCLRKREILPRGTLCNEHEYATCKKGSSCQQIPGVTFIRTRRPPTSAPPAYCVKIVKNVGGSCENKFKTICGEGLTCEKGKCVKRAKPKFNVATHYGPNVRCDEKKPCAPGLICQGKGFEKYCKLPTKIVKAGQPCFPTAQYLRECENGFKCSRNSKGFGIKSCYRETFD